MTRLPARAARIVIGLALTLGPGGALAAQATGTTTFNAPYRAFNQTELGLLVSFPDGGGTAFEGRYGVSSGAFDLGFRGGLWAPGNGAKTALLLGVEGRERVITHNPDFPLDGALIIGAGARLVSQASELIVPVGLSLGRRLDVEDSPVSIVPYAQPTAFFVADGGGHLDFALGLGADFRLSRRFDARLSAGIGDVEGISFGAVWVH